MKIFTVHQPPADPAGDTADRIDRASGLVFVFDGFNWSAALIAPVALLAGQAWAGFALYAAVLAVSAALLWWLGAASGWIVFAAIALHLFVGFEYGELRRTGLDAQGWTDLGPVSGRSLADCERRFYDRWLPGQPVIGARLPLDARAGQAPPALPGAPLRPSPTPTRWSRLLHRK